MRVVADVERRVDEVLVWVCHEVLRDLNLLKFHKTLSFGERKMLDTARRLLVQEIAVAKDKTEEAILEELEHIFSA